MKLFGYEFSVAVFRRSRAARFHGEIHRGRVHSFVKFGIANPTRHAWYAITVYIYATKTGV